MTDVVQTGFPLDAAGPRKRFRRGVISRNEALALGYSSAGVAAAVRSGEWTRLHPGAYVETALLTAASGVELHALQVAARLLVLRPGWVAARRSAAVLHELPLLGPLPSRAQLLAAPRRRTDRSGCRHERFAALPGEQVTTAYGVPATSLARTVADLARGEGLRGGLVVADAALRRGLDPVELSRVVERCGCWPGATKARAVVRLADGRSESVHESLSRMAIHELGLPTPEPQVEVWHWGVLLGRVDFLWRDQRTVGEADGMSKYVEPPVLRSEKRRQEALEDVGLEVVRWSWQESYRDTSRLGERLRRGFGRGARGDLVPGVRFVSTGVPALRRAA